jgi:hypothetical protein
LKPENILLDANWHVKVKGREKGDRGKGREKEETEGEGEGKGGRRDREGEGEGVRRETERERGRGKREREEGEGRRKRDSIFFTKLFSGHRLWALEGGPGTSHRQSDRDDRDSQLHGPRIVL